jgi:hypothetical protein
MIYLAVRRQERKAFAEKLGHRGAPFPRVGTAAGLAERTVALKSKSQACDSNLISESERAFASRRSSDLPASKFLLRERRWLRDEILLLPSRSCTHIHTPKAIMNTFAGVRLGLWCWFYFCALLAWVRSRSPFFAHPFPHLAHTEIACHALRSSRPPSSDVPRTTLACTPLRPLSSSSQACSETRSSLSGKL